MWACGGADPSPHRYFSPGGRYFAPHPSLTTEVMGLTFPSPFGVAAGFDKGGKAIPALGNLGFGHIEIGTITGQAQPGNPSPAFSVW